MSQILLVVIILAVGVGLLLFAAHNRGRHGGNIGTRSTVSALDEALGGFYREYGTLPDPRGSQSSTDGVFDTSDETGAKLLLILLGKETGGDMGNPREICFLRVPIGKNKKGGLISDENQPTGLYDLWGRGYKVLVDYDGDGQLTAPADSGPFPIPHGKRVAIYSLGEGGVGGKRAIRSW